MTVAQLTDDVSVASQITPDDVKHLADQGFRAIICNRPDNEENAQPHFQDIEAAAQAIDLPIIYMPVPSGSMTQTHVQSFKDALETLPKPVLAYCRSGTRCAALWSLSQIGQRPVDDIITRAETAGYNVGGLVQSYIERSES